MKNRKKMVDFDDPDGLSWLDAFLLGLFLGCALGVGILLGKILAEILL